VEKAAVEFGAAGEAVVFLECFRDLPDPRQRGKVLYPLAEVLLLCLLAVLGSAETFCDIARFGEKKIGLLRRFLPFRDGTPSHDHLGDIFATLDAEQFQRDGFVSADLGILEAVGFLLGGENLDVLAKRALIAFEREDVVGLLIQDFLSDVALAAHGVAASWLGLWR